MLVASRDPFHAGANHASPPPGGVPKLARAMSALQIAGTLLAIPVGLGSAYSMYRANFSVEASCQSLRANIIMILDKGENASARHMLVRRDVETFERSCGAVDPDATAAFKLLLAADKSPAVATARRVETQPKPVESKPVERKAEPRAETAAKQPAATPAVVAPMQQDAAASDGQWLEAVRSALVAHTPEPAPAGEPKAVEVKAPEPKATEPKVAKVTPAPMRPAPQDTQPLVLDSARVAPAPTLPPPTSVANAPQPAADDGHPVPPGAIPDAVPKSDERNESMLGALISHIPIVGPALVR